MIKVIVMRQACGAAPMAGRPPQAWSSQGHPAGAGAVADSAG